MPKVLEKNYKAKAAEYEGPCFQPVTFRYIWNAIRSIFKI